MKNTNSKKYKYNIQNLHCGSRSINLPFQIQTIPPAGLLEIQKEMKNTNSKKYKYKIQNLHCGSRGINLPFQIQTIPPAGNTNRSKNTNSKKYKYKNFGLHRTLYSLLSI